MEVVQSNDGFMYLKTKFPRISAAKNREGVFVGPQRRVNTIFLENHKAEICRDMVTGFVQSYQTVGYNMSLKLIS
jgi:hypothetical protein